MCVSVRQRSRFGRNFDFRVTLKIQSVSLTFWEGKHAAGFLNFDPVLTIRAETSGQSANFLLFFDNFFFKRVTGPAFAGPFLLVFNNI